MDAQSYRPLTHTIHLISSLTGANIKVSKSNTYEKIFSRHVVTFLGKFPQKKRSTNNNFFHFLITSFFFSNYIFSWVHRFRVHIVFYFLFCIQLCSFTRRFWGKKLFPWLNNYFFRLLRSFLFTFRYLFN